MTKLILTFISLAVVGYLFGNISFARIISRAKHNDITSLGSGNPGTMNMTRNFGWRIGLLTLFLDLLKAVIPCLTARLVGEHFFADYSNIMVYSTGLAVVLGHDFPVFYKFKGGKGVACTLGIFAVMFPLYFAIALVVGLLLLLAVKIGSLTSLTLVTGLSVIGIVLSNSYVEIIFISVIFILCVILHRENLVKLFKGQENKVNLFKKRDE